LKAEPSLYTRCAAAEALGETGHADAEEALRAVQTEARQNKELSHLAWVIGRVLNRMKSP
jgi:hypothetical protein